MADSTILAQQLADVQQRAEQLRQRLVQLDADIETKRSDLGKSMALGAAAGTLKNIKRELRDAEDEKEGAERGLVFLGEETERLKRELTSARAAEAAADRDVKVAEAVAAIDEMASALYGWAKETFMPLADAAEALSEAAFQTERKAALLGDKSNVTSRVQRCWTRHAGLAEVTRLLLKYSKGAEDRRS